MDPVFQIFNATMALQYSNPRSSNQILEYLLLMCCAKFSKPFKIVTIKSLF